MYDSSNQYRCTIIRGKAKNDIDNLLPVYSRIIADLCPCERKTFEMLFNEKLADVLGIDRITKSKTLDNHRTEIAGKLFGMYYPQIGIDGKTQMCVSERTMKFIEDGDQPAFFKDVCFKMQFPNGMSKPDAARRHVEEGIRFRNCCYVIEFLFLAKAEQIAISIDDIAYYVLNSKDVMMGLAEPREVLDALMTDRNNGISRKVSTEGKESSYDMQHIREQLNYLELANLIVVNDRHLHLNLQEEKTIGSFRRSYNSVPFDAYQYDLNSKEGRCKYQRCWDEYYSKLSQESRHFDTSIAALVHGADNDPSPSSTHPSTTELGDQGEAYVMAYERNRVGKIDKRLVSKVVHLGKTKGIGYDIQSVVGGEGEDCENPILIEVKTTKRTTEPDFNSNTWDDSFDITQNEYVASRTYGDNYYIYRLIIVRGKIIILVIRNISEKQKSGVVRIRPLKYSVLYNHEAVDKIIERGERELQ